MSSKWQRCAGLSLLEVLVVMVIMASSTLGLLALHRQMTETSRLMRQQQQATQLANTQLMQWRAKVLAADRADRLSVSTLLQNGQRQSGQYELHWQVTQPLGAGSYLVKLDVRWQNRAKTRDYARQFMMLYSRLPVVRLDNNSTWSSAKR